ncbi:MAG TPA: SBBP repeat-containing protein [Bryobacteraceae bacterium]|nr:SBBP repeat-containing protein [Bryobacteraceae bacterium]
MLRPSVFSFLLISSLAFAAPPGVRSALVGAPLAFEKTAEGSLIARRGPYSLAVAGGTTTVQVRDRGNGVSVTTRLENSTASTPEGQDPLEAKANYFLGADPAAWRAGAPLFARVVERGVYRGIDLVFHGDGSALEYDFVVAPGANPRRIGLDISGTSALRLDADGTLVIATPGGEIRWKKPEVYQSRDGVREPVAGRFALAGRRVTFAIGPYDRTRQLVIDPILAYATYLGGSDNEAGRGVALDGSGNIYVTGFTESMNLPHTGGSFQPSFHGGTAGMEFGGDAFVAKYTSAGTLVYTTYLGGSSDDGGFAIAVDSAGDAYVTGFTTSSDFPTQNALQPKYGGQGNGLWLQAFGDAFVTKLNPSGSALVYSTYLGGSNDEQGFAIAVDSAGDAYVAGATQSANFPTASAYQSTYKGGGGSPAFCCGSSSGFVTFGDGFVSKLNPAGSALLFSTYFGGSLDDAVATLALDSSGNVYAGGFTVSTNFPTLNAYQSKFGGASNPNAQPFITTGDGWIAKFNSSGGLQYSTYLGGNNDDGVLAIAVDSTGAVYATGYTSSTNFPVSSNAAQKTLGGPTSITGAAGFVFGDAFVAKLAPSGSSLAWATYLGGSLDDSGLAIAVDAGGNAIVGGFSNTTNLPVTSNALQSAFGGGDSSDDSDPSGDGFLAKVSADGTAFLYLSYYGGSDNDAITSLTLDPAGDVIAVGTTASQNLPGTAKGAQPNFGGDESFTGVRGDAFMTIFSGIAAAAGPPVITAVSNEGSFTGTLAPGSAAAVFGTNLPTSASAGATVGVQAAQVVYASASEWVIVIPSAVAAGATTVQVGSSAAFPITISLYAPALFSADGSGSGIALAQRVLPTGNVTISAAAPALPGDTVYIYATGLGANAPNQLPAVMLGTVQVSVFSITAAGNEPGAYQIAIQVPPSTPAGNPALVLSLGGVSSQSLTLPVGAITGTTIEYVENAASYLPGFSPGSWVTITGANLAGSTRTWTAADFNGSNLPTTLDNVSVTIDNKPAYIYYISPTQINVLAPADTAQAPVPVQVTYKGTQSNSLMAPESSFSPALFTFSPAGGRYVAAVRIDGQYIGPTSLYPSLTVPASPGDTLELYGTGFGPTNPSTNFAQTFTGAPVTTNTVTATIGGVTATVEFAGLVYPGEYQFNILVPNGVPAGDNLVVLKVNGITTQANAYLTIQ